MVVHISEIKVELDYQVRFSKTTRDEALRRANYKCELCPVGKERRKGLTFHHTQIWAHRIREYKIPATLTDCPDNVLVVCHACHKELHRSKKIQPLSELITGINIIGQLNEVEHYADLMILSIRMKQ